MSNIKKGNSQTKRRAPAKTPEARERQLISLAVDLAEQQLSDGTATSQVITHYLKLGSTKDQIEQDILRERKKLLEAQTEAIQSGKRVEELYKNALDAMRSYSGQTEAPEDYDE